MKRELWGLAAGTAVFLATVGCGWQSGTVKQADLPAPPQPKVPTYATDPGAALMRNRVTFEVEGVHLAEVVRRLGQAAGVETLLDEKVDRARYDTKVTMRLKNVAVGAALFGVTGTGGLTYCFDGRRVVVTEPQRLTPEQQTEMDAFREKLEKSWRPTMENTLQGSMVSCDLEAVPANDFFEFVLESYGINCRVQKPASRPVTVTVKRENVSLASVLDEAGKQMNMDWVLEDEGVLFTPKKPE